jgi:hypothetical protein
VLREGRVLPVMTRAEIEAWDERRRESLDRETGVDVVRTRKLAKQREEALKPPTPERIQEVSEAVLIRRANAISEELRRRREDRSPERVQTYRANQKRRRIVSGLPPGFEGA